MFSGGGRVQRRLAVCLLICPLLVPAMAAASDTEQAPVSAPDEQRILVLASSSLQARQRGLGNLSNLDQTDLALVMPTHIHELMVRVPGVWVSRGSGQEHLTAIRSAVFSGPGACGAFLYLENGISIRPVGFCNVNQLFELNTEQAAAVEVVRGPASALFGGNALYGLFNVRGPDPMALTPALLLEAGPYDHQHLRLRTGAQHGQQHWRLDLQATDADGFQRDTGLRQQKLSVSQAGGLGHWSVRSLLSATHLEQQTGGFVIGYRAYADSALRRSNANPDAFRDAWSVRMQSTWERSLTATDSVQITPYWRRSRMQFSQHFLPGTPLEWNGQQSLGAQLLWHRPRGAWDWQLGAAVEAAEGYLRQYQAAPAQGVPAVVAIRPLGWHYDYRVRSQVLAGFYDLRWQLRDDLAVVHGLRLERLRYDYDNRMLSGNTRDDGSACDFGGCLYNRPADRRDGFTNPAARLGLDWQLHPAWSGYVLVGNGFRPPQATELYRLQRGQDVADLDSERLLTAELGLRGGQGRITTDMALYRNRADRIILRDAAGLNISDGRTRSLGLEFSLDTAVSSAHSWRLAGSYNRHQYAFDLDVAGGEQIRRGRDMDTAPRWLASSQWQWQPAAGWLSEMEAVYQGRYYLDAENSASYPGHLLWHWRGSWQTNENVRLFARIINLTNRRYAERADYAFGNYRYFVGMPRQLYLGIEAGF